MGGQAANRRDKQSLLEPVARYYDSKLGEHGATAKGVDWNGDESQRLRFEMLCKLLPETGSYSLLDYGCGYGGLLDFLKPRTECARYVGYDISERMIESARERHPSDGRATFTTDAGALKPCDFAVASGVFNVKLDAVAADWERFILDSLDKLNELGTRGYAFNLLSLYSDVEKRRDHLFYADPLKLFDHCKRKHSKYVSLLHDYPLYEFTLVIRKG